MRSAPTLEALVDVQRGVPLAGLTTYRFGGPARFYAEIDDEEQLGTVLAARLNAPDPPIDLLVLGRGSNVVVSDAGFDGLVLRLGESFLDVTIGSDGEVTAGGAVLLPALARRCVRTGRGGLEWCVGIPGSVGGAVRMNAGGHGSDVAEWLISADVYDASLLHLDRRSVSDLDLGYRSSNLRTDHVVMRASFRTIERDAESGEQMLRAITRWRRDHQPGGTLNAGSVFKNPPNDNAGRIIDELGLKGYRVGGAFVSSRHANFLEAESDASAQDVYDVVHAVHREVERATGTSLVPEIQFVGEFDATGRDPGKGSS